MSEVKKLKRWQRSLIIVGGVIVLLLGTAGGIVLHAHLYGKN